MKYSIVFFFGLLSMGLNAQQIQFLDLPSFFNREFEISGLTGNEENLFLAAERCGKIFVVKKEGMTHVKTIHLNLEEIRGGLEIEGLSIYKDFLLITDEKGGRIFSLGLKNNGFKELLPIGKDVRSFRGKYGMEGVAVDEDSNTLYLLREKNIDNQSEIHSILQEMWPLKLNTTGSRIRIRIRFRLNKNFVLFQAEKLAANNTL